MNMPTVWQVLLWMDCFEQIKVCNAHLFFVCSRWIIRQLKRIEYPWPYLVHILAIFLGGHILAISWPYFGSTGKRYYIIIYKLHSKLREYKLLDTVSNALGATVPGTKEILQVTQNERKCKIFFLLYSSFGHLLATFSRKETKKGCRTTPLKHFCNSSSKQPIHSGTRHTVGIFIQTQFNVLVEHRLGLMTAHTHHLLDAELL